MIVLKYGRPGVFLISLTVKSGKIETVTCRVKDYALCPVIL